LNLKIAEFRLASHSVCLKAYSNSNSNSSIIQLDEAFLVLFGLKVIIVGGVTC